MLPATLAWISSAAHLELKMTLPRHRRLSLAGKLLYILIPEKHLRKYANHFFVNLVQIYSIQRQLFQLN